jgi:F420-dependent oxidoreductase-like protein
VRLPYPCVVILVGPSGAGKSTWAAEQLEGVAGVVVSSDDLRGVVGTGRHDQRASKDAFDALDLIVERRLKRGLLTVIDTLGLDDKRRKKWLERARHHHMPCHIVAFDTEPEVCRARNKARSTPVPFKVLTDQLAAFIRVDAALGDEGFDGVHRPDDVTFVPPLLHDAPAAAHRQQEDPMPLQFGLQIPNFTWEGGPPELATRLTDIAQAAEQAGFTSLWVMDHFFQIPQVGREWLDMLDSWTTLSFLAAKTSSIRLGPLVTGVTYRNVAHLAKIVATVDVLSGGRVTCGIGTAWFEREHLAYGWEFPPIAERYQLLEDALEVLPLLWGKGSPAFEGRRINVPEAMSYPRPLQDKVPIMIGGSGEKKTLRLVARYADACNLFGDPDTVRHKLTVLRDHCATEGRDPSTIEVTHLSTALTANDPDELAATIERLRPESIAAEAYAARTNAGTIDDHIGHYRQLAEAGVQTAIVNLPDLSGTEPVERFAEIIAAFADGAG